MLERWEEAHPFPLNYGGVSSMGERGRKKIEENSCLLKKERNQEAPQKLDLISGAYFRDTHSHTQVPALNCSREKKVAAPLS